MKIFTEKQKEQARSKARHAVRSGALKRKPCEKCGAKKTHAHHENYSKPLEVHWLCPRHHEQRHTQIAFGKKYDHTDPIEYRIKILERNPEKEWGLMDIVFHEIMPWARNSRTVRSILTQQATFLHTRFENNDGSNKRRYFVKASELIAYLKAYGPALLGTVRKTKPHHEKRRNKDSGNSRRRTTARKASKHIRSAKRLPRRAEADGKNRTR